MKKKVLFIYYHFPPLLGDWRGLGFVKFLPEFGWQPIVISAEESVSYEKDYSLIKHLPQEIEVHRVGHRQPSKEWEYLRRKLKINFDFPDEYKSWYFPTLREARKILQKEKVDLIFTSASPFTSPFVAMKLKKEFNIPWITEFRDPWSGNDSLNQYYDKTSIKPLRKLQKFLIKRGERDILKVADKTIVVSWHHRQQLSNLHGFEKKEIEVITNGYDEPDFTGLNPFVLYPDKLSITFLGSFYPIFREILLNFLKVINEIEKDVETIFIGCGAIQLQKINRANFTRILHLPKEKALAFASGSDFPFVVVPPYARWWIPMKIFDYLRLGKPILAIVPEDGDAAKIIREAKAGFILSHNPEKMKEQLKNIFEDWKKGKFKDFHPDWEYIAQFERKKLTKRLANIFNKVIGD